jgi:D-alanyl-lipoteichoic acid acyltransferase DltB (MBOAT superfamily)
MMFGLVLVWGLARTARTANPLIAGWIGMVGLTFVLHFGFFNVLALVWRQKGVMASPLMQNPLAAKTLAEFWGRRWNTAFNELALRFAFRPLRRIANSEIATLLVYLISGLIHELVISLPARGGYGLPTSYFLLQGLGVIAERSRLGRVVGLGRGAFGRMFTVLMTAVPAVCLFHPTFLRNVILPMLAAIGAT